MGLVAIPDDVPLDGTPSARQGLIPLPDGTQLDSDVLNPDGTVRPQTSPAGIAATSQSLSPHTLMQKVGHGMGDIGLGLGEAFANSADSTLAGADALGDKFKNSTPPPAAIGPAVSDYITNRENNWQANRAANNDTGTEWARGAGQALSAAPLMAMLPESAPGIVGGAVGGAETGAAAAALQPVGNTKDGYANAKLSQISEGAGLGGIGGAVLGWFGGSSATKPVQDKYRDAVNFLRDRDVVPTIGQTIGPGAASTEDMLSSINLNVPGAQQRALETFNVGALNEALSPLGLSYKGPMGRDAFEKVGQIFDRAYGSIKGQISLPVSDDLRIKIGQIVSDAATPDASIAKTTQNILDKTLYNQVDENGVLSGDAFKKAESDLGKFAQRYTGTGATATEQGIGEALQNIQGALRDSLENANPQQATQLRAINRGYAILKRVQDAVPVGNPDSKFTPYQLAASVARGDNTAGGRAYTEGQSLLQNYSDAGLRVLGNKFPDSGTARRMFSADPFAAVTQAGVTAATKPFYGPIGSAVTSGVMNAGSSAVSNAPKLLAPLARGAQRISPYVAPGLLGMSRGSLLGGP